MKWQSLKDGEMFDYDIDRETKIPTIESYRALDITEDKRYTPYLEEFWLWANGVDGREINPTRDCLHLWVEGREEVKPIPGIRIQWSSDIFPDQEKRDFIKVEAMDNILSVNVAQIYHSEEDQRAVQIFIPADEQIKLNSGKPTVKEEIDGEVVDKGWCRTKLTQQRKIKEKYNLAYIDGFEGHERTIELSKQLVEGTEDMEELIALVKELAKVICVPL
jgi:hypothetical protein